MRFNRKLITKLINSAFNYSIMKVKVILRIIPKCLNAWIMISLRNNHKMKYNVLKRNKLKMISHYLVLAPGKEANIKTTFLRTIRKATQRTTWGTIRGAIQRTARGTIRGAT